MAKFSADETHQLIVETLVRCNTSEANAGSVAQALVGAELAGQTGHGLRRVETYGGQAASGKVDGHAVPVAERTAAAALNIDARYGFAYPALDIAIDALPDMARECGIAMAGIRNSHHCGVVGLTVEKFAEQGLVALMFANTPSAIAPWGGNKGMFGTNPIAFAAPQASGPPVVVDVAMSKVARGKLLAASQKGEAIPEGWAFDAEGKPTTNAKAGLAGTMAPLGDAKGTALALMIELMAAGITSSNTSDLASSFFEAEGTPPGVGQSVIVIDPVKFGGTDVLGHIGGYLAKISAQEGARIPGHRRHEIRERLLGEGIEIDDALLASIRAVGS